MFDQLIQTFNLDVPALTKDPVGFFASHLETSLVGGKPEDGEERESDVYAIRAVIERLNELRAQEQPPSSEVEALLEDFRNAIRQSNHRRAIIVAGEVRIEDLAPDQLREICSALTDAAPALDDNSPEELAAYDWVVTAVERLEILGQGDLSARTQAAKALANKGLTLGALNRSEEEIAAYEEVVRRFGDATQPALLECVATALFAKGVTLGTLNRSEEEIAAYEEVVRRFGDAAEPTLREQVAKALVAKGSVLGTLNRNEDAIAAYEGVLRRFGEATELALREQVGKALFNEGLALGTLNRREDAIAAYEEAVRRFGESAEPGLREPLARALVNKGLVLETLNRSEDAIAAYEEVVRRFGDATERELREQVLRARAGIVRLKQPPS